MGRNLLRTILVVFFAISVFAQSSDAWGPWKAQVVDAETKQPLKEVVVVAIWQQLIGLRENPSFAYYDSEEVITGDDGWFTIKAQTSLVVFGEPEFYFFKPGYGQWRFQGEDQWLELEPLERRKRYIDAGKQFESNGVVIELPLLKTREERVRFYYDRPQPFSAPVDRKRNWLQATESERRYLGL